MRRNHDRAMAGVARFRRRPPLRSETVVSVPKRPGIVVKQLVVRELLARDFLLGTPRTRQWPRLARWRPAADTVPGRRERQACADERSDRSAGAELTI